MHLINFTLLVFSWLLNLSHSHTLGGTLCLNACSGHGKCMVTTNVGATCVCNNGWGSSSDITSYRAPDCSSRTCPSGKAWAWVATSNVSSHRVVECSNRGVCEHSTGLCKCMAGFTGGACERKSCPNDCSGHGRCMSMKAIAVRTDAMPLSNPTSYQVQLNSGDVGENLAWDDDKIFACVCDSSWAVGLGANETQEAEWFGPDCSQRHCLSGNDPMTAADETNCHNITAPGGGNGVGKEGNLCHVECANRGICDYSSGLCRCFKGFYGSACTLNEANTFI